MMIDRNIAACAPATVYRVLSQAGLLKRWNAKPSLKGTGFVQPLLPHQHWHVDVSYLNIAGTFYYLCSVLDGASRAIVHWDIRERMTEADIEQILQKAKECHPGVTPRIITDNGPQFLAKDFKEFIRISGMTHVKTSPYDPQSNGKIERFHRTLKHDAVRMQTPLSKADADCVVGGFILHYNTVCLAASSSITTPFACTVPSATSPRTTSSPDVATPSMPNETANSKRLVNVDDLPDKCQIQSRRHRV